MSSSSSDQSTEQCEVCGSLTNRKSKQLCLACYVFFYRNCDKLRQLKCQTGTNKCSLNVFNAVRISNGNLLRMLCRRCRLDRCFQVTTKHNNNNNNTNDNINNNQGDQYFAQTIELALATSAREAAEQFESIWFQWLSNADGYDLIGQVSANVVRFSHHVPGFTLLSDRIKMMLNFQAIPLITLVLAEISTVPGINLVPSVFPEVKSTKLNSSMTEKFLQWHPSNFEIGCLLAVILFRNCTESDGDSFKLVLQSIDGVLKKIEIANRKDQFIDILSIVLASSSGELFLR